MLLHAGPLTVSQVRKIHAKSKKKVIQRERKPCYCEKNNSKSSDNEALRRVGGMKGRWERQERQSFPAARWHTHTDDKVTTPPAFIFCLYLLTSSSIALLFCSTLSLFTFPHKEHQMTCVTHTTQALNESVEKARILAAFVFTDPI